MLNNDFSSPLSERLHRLERPGSRSPLFLYAAVDRGGHLLDARVCDPDEYRYMLPGGDEARPQPRRPRR